MSTLCVVIKYNAFLRYLQEILRSNENYRQISHLEEKLTDLIKENKILQESLAQLKKVQ